jgi:hypothetical protein
MLSMFRWMAMFEGKMNALSSILLSINIKVSELIFARMVVFLTDFENHKYQEDYFNSYLSKYFGFQFVNNYSAFLYLSSTPPSGPSAQALHSLRGQLSSAIIVLAVCSIIEVGLSALKVKFNLWNEHREMTKAGKEYRWRSSAESQAKFREYKVREQIDTMLPLVLSLGHMLMFGAIAPIIIPFGLINFAVNLRASAYMLTFTTKRAYPHQTMGIGQWRNIIQFMSVVGLVYSAFLFVFYGETFENTGLKSKMSGAIMFCLAMGGCWYLVDVVCPARCGAAYLLEERREHVLHRLFVQSYQQPDQDTEAHSESGTSDNSKSDAGATAAPAGTIHDVHSARSKEGALAAEVEEERWDAIPILEHLNVHPKDTY